MQYLSWRYASTVMALALAYFGTGWLGVRLAYSADSVTLIWPPAGIALAAGLLLGYRVWPGVLLGEAAVLTVSHLPLPVICGAATGNALAMLAAVWLLKRAGFDRRLQRVRDVVALAILGGAMAMTVSASTGVLALVLNGLLTWSVAVSTWFKWWLGDTLGVLLVAPIFLAYQNGQTAAEPGSASMTHRVAALVILAATGGISFGGWLHQDYLWLPLTFVPFPCLVWITLRMGMNGSAAALLVMAVIAVTGTALGFGPFVRPDVNESLSLLWGFLATIGLTTLLLSAALAEQRQLAMALRESERFNRAVLNSLQAGISILNHSGTIIAVNEAWQRFAIDHAADAAPMGVGVNYSELCQRAMGGADSKLVPECRVGLRAVLEGRLTEFEQEYPRLSPTEKRWFLMRAVPMRQEAGGLVLSHIDVTRLKQMEQALQLSKEAAERANAAKSRFLAAASHDLRQPLQTIGLLNEVLAKRAKDPETLEIVQQLGKAVAAMTDLLAALLDISKLAAGTITPKISDFPVGDLLDRMRVDFARQAVKAGVALRIVPCAALVHSDPVLLERIVQNFLSNALSHAQAGKVLLGCRRRGAKLRIEVWDNGIGITETQYQAIFEEFYQLDNPARDRREGLGLGLTIAERMARLLEHAIGVHSRLGKGSVFAVEVPRAHAQPAPRETRPVPQANEIRSATLILLIDDEPSVLKALCMFLENKGFMVLPALNGREALERIEGGAVHPDLVISDYRLPADETGIQVIEAVQSAVGHAIPAILLTGDTSSERVWETQQSGCLVLHKPVDGAQLTALIQRLLRETEQSGTVAYHE